jgi:hypothetical protein
VIAESAAQKKKPKTRNKAQQQQTQEGEGNTAEIVVNLRSGDQIAVTGSTSASSRGVPAEKKKKQRHKNKKTGGRETQQQEDAAAATAGKKNKLKLCRYGAACTVPNCRFGHPEPLRNAAATGKGTEAAAAGASGAGAVTVTREVVERFICDWVNSRGGEVELDQLAAGLGSKKAGGGPAYVAAAKHWTRQPTVAKAILNIVETSALFETGAADGGGSGGGGGGDGGRRGGKRGQSGSRGGGGRRREPR